MIRHVCGRGNLKAARFKFASPPQARMDPEERAPLEKGPAVGPSQSETRMAHVRGRRASAKAAAPLVLLSGPEGPEPALGGLSK